MHATGSELYRGLGAEHSSALMDLNLELDSCRRAVSRYGEPVLEIGCGQGNILLALRAEGIDVDGCDLSLDMLAIAAHSARERGLGVSLYWQAMQDLSLPRRYRTILVPSGALMHLTDPSEVMDTLQRIHQHLLPGGGLLLVLCPAGQASPPEGSVLSTTSRLLPGTDGAQLRIDSSWTVADGLDPVERWQRDIRLERAGEVIRHETRVGSLRSYTAMELAVMMAWTGFVDLDAGRPDSRASRPGPRCTLLTARRRS